MATRLQRYAFIGIAAYIVLLGGAYYYQIFGVRVFHHVLITALLLIWLGARLLRRRGLPPTPLNPLLYACVGVWFASAILSADPRMALENIWFPLTHLSIFFIFVDLLQSGRESLLVETIFLIAAIVALLAGAQLLSWLFGWGFATPAVGWLSVLSADAPALFRSIRLYVPLGVSTWLSAFTAPLAVLASVWAWSARRRDARVAFALLAFLLVVIMLLTGSRGGWISLAAGGGSFLALELIASDRSRAFVRRFILPLGIAALIAVAGGAFVLIRLSSDAAHSSGDVLRFDLWRGALGIAADHPVLGVGVGGFARAYREIRDPVYVDNRLGTAHNFYFNTLAETGIIGAVVAVALGVVLVLAWWRLWRGAPTPSRRLRLQGSFAALVGLGAHSFFDTFTTPALVLLALALAAYSVTDLRSRLDPPLKGDRLPAYAATLLVLIFGAALFRADQAQAAFRASIGGSLSDAQQAANLDPALHLYDLQIAYLTGEAADTTAAITAYRGALDLEPTWDTGWINLAALYVRQGDTAAALDALQRASAIDHRSGALLLWARLAEQTDAAPPDAIIDAYQRHLRGLRPGVLPLASFWSETPLRREVLDWYVNLYPADFGYRALAVHNPTRLAAFVPAEPVNAPQWWAVGQYALTIENDPRKAEAAFTEAIRRVTDHGYQGDYFVSRARARLTIDPAAAHRDLDTAVLLGTFNEYPAAVRAALTPDDAQARALLAAAVPPRVVDQNFEGVLFAGRTAAFDFLPEMQLPGPGRPVMQPWYDLAARYEAAGDTAAARNVYAAILDRAPDEADAQAALTRLSDV